MDKSTTTTRGRKPKWTDEKVEIMCKAIADGRSYKDAYTAARVGHDSFYRHLREDAEFSARVKKAEQTYQEYFDSQLVADCKRSLRELVCGYEYDEVIKESGIDPKTGKKVEKTKSVHKRMAPNATAIIFALCNRDPEHWQNRVSQDVNGKIDVEQKGNGVSLANVPDSLLAQVIDAINGK